MGPNKTEEARNGGIPLLFNPNFGALLQGSCMPPWEQLLGLCLKPDAGFHEPLV